MGAGAATAFGWAAWVETDTVTGATTTTPAPQAVTTLTKGPAKLAAARQAAVLVCQATGDGGYVLIRVLPDRLAEYRRNPNNIVPAPSGGCPARVGASTPIPTSTAPAAEPPATTSTQTTPPRTTTTTPRTTPTTTTPRTTTTPTTPRTTTTTTPPRATSPATTAPSRTTTTTEAATPSSSGTAPAAANGTKATPRSKTYTGKLPANLERLPNTGNETALLLFFGVDLLLLGAGLRLRSRRFGF